MSVTNPVNTTSNETQTIVISTEKNVVANFKMVDGIWMISSVEVARIFERRHDNLVANMKRDHKVQMNKLIGMRQMKDSSWKDSTGRTNSMYMLGEYAFNYFVLGLNGKLAKEYRLSFIEAFMKLREVATHLLNHEHDKAVEAAEQYKNNLENAIKETGTLDMGTFTKLIQNKEMGMTAGRTKLYQLLRDMRLVAQDENRHTNKGDDFLNTVIHKEHGGASVRVKRSTLPNLIKRIAKYLADNKGYEEFRRDSMNCDQDLYLPPSEDVVTKFENLEPQHMLYSKNGVYDAMKASKDEFVDIIMDGLAADGFIGEAKYDLNGNFVGDGYRDATFDTNLITFKRDANGNTFIMKD